MTTENRLGLLGRIAFWLKWLWSWLFPKKATSLQRIMKPIMGMIIVGFLTMIIYSVYFGAAWGWQLLHKH